MSYTRWNIHQIPTITTVLLSLDPVSKMTWVYAIYSPSSTAASAYENVEWINKLVSYVTRIATSRPDIKIIGTLRLPHNNDSILLYQYTLGICFGHQIVARALGGECVPNSGKWEAGMTEIDLTDLGKQLFGADKLVHIILKWSILMTVCICTYSCSEHPTNAPRPRTFTPSHIPPPRIYTYLVQPRNGPIHP